MDFLEFRGGPNDGSVVRWPRRSGPVPLAWNHVEKVAVQLDVGADGLPVDGSMIAGESVDDRGRRVYWGEERIWHRYRATPKVGSFGAVVLEHEDSTVPLSYDHIKERWESPYDYTDDAQSERFRDVVVESCDKEDQDDGCDQG